MGTTCEVIGWLLDSDRAQVMVREANGAISLQTSGPDSFSQRAIQTGRFNRSELDYTSSTNFEIRDAQAQENHIQKG